MSNVNTITVNDEIGHRGRRHMNVLVASNGILPFKGNAIPGAVRVEEERFDKRGNWSASYWELELAEGIRMETLSQDWDTGEWIISKTWQTACAELREKLKAPDLQDEAVKAFIRAELPPAVSLALDQEDVMWAASMDGFDQLLAAQREAASILQEAQDREYAELLRQEASTTIDKVAQARTMLKEGASLADLKALLG
ncbi:MAG: hypothetical protein ACR2HF_02670 [Methylococcaceae bacterium]